jgi:hypothetical protein
LDVNKAHMREWRDALRQAHALATPQTRGLLNRVEDGLGRVAGFCCMGIWCEVAADAGRLTRQQAGAIITYYGEDAEMPSTEVDYLGVGRTDPILLSTADGTGDCLMDRKRRVLHYTASQLNDSIRLNFDQIADCMTWTYSLDEEDA